MLQKFLLESRWVVDIRKDFIVVVVVPFLVVCDFLYELWLDVTQEFLTIA